MNTTENAVVSCLFYPTLEILLTYKKWVKVKKKKCQTSAVHTSVHKYMDTTPQACT